ncbi:MAG: GntR family transcriptional regulator [Propioniciclava sp.]|uniref:GntR family transcriptional regulator n=1 Tax=Propioniciclava sp. TaxID=2038686 RepID=UPI0039E53EDA
MPDPAGSLDEPFVLPVRLERSSPTPLYHQIAQPLESMILAGQLEPGRLIEDEVSMAQRLNVSRPTARRALQDLVNRGLLTRRRGVGTRVTPSHVRRPLALTSLNEDLVKAGFDPRTEVLSYQVKFADEEEALHLGCEAGAEIVRIERRRWIDDRVLAILRNLLPADSAPSLTQLSGSGPRHGLYACLEQRNIHPASAQQSVGARAADAADADRLDVKPGSAMLTMRRTAYDSDGRIIEYGSHIYNADLYSFQFTLVAE